MVELRWFRKSKGGDMIIGCEPTATDALEYANQKLKERAEFDLCMSDIRLNDMHMVKKLLEVAKNDN